MTITDAVRRATRKRITGKEEELGEDAEKMAPGWSADQLRGVIGDDILAELMQGADRPQLARRLVGLQQAGVDLGTFLPRMGRMTAGVHQAVVVDAARTKVEGTDRWAELLKATMPEGVVRDAILSSPAWPDIAADMGRLDARGIDVARILLDAHRAGSGVDQAVAAVTTAAAQAPAQAPRPGPCFRCCSAAGPGRAGFAHGQLRRPVGRACGGTRTRTRSRPGSGHRARSHPRCCAGAGGRRPTRRTRPGSVTLPRTLASGQHRAADSPHGLRRGHVHLGRST